MSRDYCFSRLLVTVTPTDLIDHTNGLEEMASCSLLPMQSSHSTTHHREYRIRIVTEKKGTSRNYDDNNENDDDNGNDSTTLVLCETQMRFSEFYRRFTESSHFSIKPASSMFPPRGFLWDDYTTNMTNVQRRTKFIQIYLDCMLNDSGYAILLSPFLYKALEVDEEGQKQFGDIAQQRQCVQDQRQGEKREKTQRAMTLKNDRWGKAQSINLTKLEERTSLRFFVPCEFRIECSLFTAGRTNISLASTKWFELERSDFPKLAPFSEITFKLRGATGRALLEIKCSFGLLEFWCKIFYITNSGELVGAVQVHRQWQLGWIEEVYKISSIGTTVKDRYSCGGPPSHLKLGVNGRNVATLHTDFFRPNYTLRISPDQDCLLLVAISCVVAKIQTEICHRRRSGHRMP